MECVPARLLRVRCRLLWATALLGTAGAGESVPSQDSREPDRSAGNFGTAIHRYAHEKTWTQRWSDVQLTRQILSQSVEGARTFLLNHQKAEGNFIYGYDIVVNHALENDNQVRQAGTLWSLATLCLERPTPATHQAAIRGLDFFFR